MVGRRTLVLVPGPILSFFTERTSIGRPTIRTGPVARTIMIVRRGTGVVSPVTLLLGRLIAVIAIVSIAVLPVRAITKSAVIVTAAVFAAMLTPCNIAAL